MPLARFAPPPPNHVVTSLLALNLVPIIQNTPAIAFSIYRAVLSSLSCRASAAPRLTNSDGQAVTGFRRHGRGAATENVSRNRGPIGVHPNPVAAYRGRGRRPIPERVTTASASHANANDHAIVSLDGTLTVVTITSTTTTSRSKSTFAVAEGKVVDDDDTPFGTEGEAGSRQPPPPT